MGLFGLSVYEKYLSEQNRCLEHDNKKLNAYIKSMRASCGYDNHESIFYQTNREEALADELKSKQIGLLEAEQAIKLLKSENANLKNELHKLRWKADKFAPAEVKEKEREIETLKEMLKFSDSDHEEWEEHKEIFNFMTRKRNYIEEENSDLRSKVRTFKNKTEEEIKKREDAEKELLMYREFFTQNEVKVFVKDKEIDTLNAATTDLSFQQMKEND